MAPTGETPAGTRFRWTDLLVSAAGLTLFGVGLLSPLTPSRGCPTAPDVLVFLALPVLVVAGGAVRRSGVARLSLAVQAILTAGAGLWLLARVGCLP